MFILYVSLFTNGQTKTAEIYSKLKRKDVVDAKCILTLFLEQSTGYITEDPERHTNDSFCNIDKRMVPTSNKRHLRKMKKNSRDGTLKTKLDDIFKIIDQNCAAEWEIINGRGSIDYMDSTFQELLDRRCQQFLNSIVEVVDGLGRLKGMVFMHLCSLSGLLPYCYYTWATIDKYDDSCNTGPTYMYSLLNGVNKDDICRDFQDTSAFLHQHIGLFPSMLENFLCELSRSTKYRSSSYSKRAYEHYYVYQSIYQLRYILSKKEYVLKQIKCDGSKSEITQNEVKLY